MLCSGSALSDPIENKWSLKEKKKAVSIHKSFMLMIILQSECDTFFCASKPYCEPGLDYY